VYHLALLETEEKKRDGEPLYHAVFAVKCYPYPHDTCFPAFSFLDQTLIQSRFFDETTTPVFEYREKIPSDLFNVAMLEITMDGEANIARFCMETLDTLRSRYAFETDQSFPMVETVRKFGVGEIDRDIPGVEIAYPLFDCLMCLYANAGKQAPIQIQCSKTPGFEFVIESGGVKATPKKAINGYRLAVVCAAADRKDPANHAPLPIDWGEHEDDIFYKRMFPCGHFHDDEADANLPVSINKKWWSLAHGQYVSELASSCGCH
jgi:hypothetical protein